MTGFSTAKEWRAAMKREFDALKPFRMGRASNSDTRSFLEQELMSIAKEIGTYRSRYCGSHVKIVVEESVGKAGAATSDPFLVELQSLVPKSLQTVRKALLKIPNNTDQPHEHATVDRMKILDTITLWFMFKLQLDTLEAAGAALSAETLARKRYAVYEEERQTEVVHRQKPSTDTQSSRSFDTSTAARSELSKLSTTRHVSNEKGSSTRNDSSLKPRKKEKQNTKTRKKKEEEQKNRKSAASSSSSGEALRARTRQDMSPKKRPDSSVTLPVRFSGTMEQRNSSNSADSIEAQKYCEFAHLPRTNSASIEVTGIFKHLIG